MNAFGCKPRALMLVILTATLALAVSLTSAPTAMGAGPWWHISSETVPASLPAGGEGQIIIVATNLGDAPANAGEEPVNIAIKLPAGMSASSIAGTGCSLATLRCSSSEGVVNPYGQKTVSLTVKAASSGGPLPVQASVEGGGAAKTGRTVEVPVGGEPAGFGVEEYALEPFTEQGTPATHAGAHPFELTTTLVLNQVITPNAAREPVAQPKDFSFQLPAGLVGNPNAAQQCSMVDFFALVFETDLCSPGSVVGVATVKADEPKTLKVFSQSVPVFNLVPAQGEPARFGFEVAGRIPIVIDASVRSGSDYGVNVSVQDATQTAGLLSTQVTLWGVPGDPRHDNARGWECVAGGAFAKEAGKSCPETSGLPEEPFLTLPTSCAADPQREPVLFTMRTDSWAKPENSLGAEYAWMNGEGQPLGFEGCSELPFSPAIDVMPEEHSASTPSGVDVSVKVPQRTTLEAGGLAEADVRDTTVTLPEGVALSPSAANGLEACSEAQVGFTGFDQASQTNKFNTAPASCPDGSKVGTVRIKTPLLSHQLEGAVYLASPAPNGEAGHNPFNSLVTLYLVAEDPVSGVLVKLAGEGHIDEGTLRISTTFHNTPQVPFEELELHLFGGPRASVTTPPLCGAYATDAAFTPWSGAGPVSAQAPAGDFEVTQGVGGSSCPGPMPFSPGFMAGSSGRQAGAFTSFNLELARPDGNQALGGLSMHLPAGIAAMLSSVQLCSDAQVAASACPAASEVGQAVAFAGLGPEPYVQTGGRVYITGPYNGAPFGLSIVTPAVAGPFNLGEVIVRSRLFVNPNDASITIVSDPLPTELRGIPLQLKRVLVTVDRPNFEFNPTNCAPLRIDATIAGSEGALAPVASPFQVAGCQNLPFHPGFSSSTQAHTSKADGASLSVKVSSSQGQANIGKAAVILPKVLPSRLSTIQKACVDRVFDANPALCPEGSLVGLATVHTPVLRSALTGPAYLVSHGGAAFPDLEFVLQGEGITLILDGQTAIRKGVTSSTFNSLPDAPVSSFETVLPEGPHSALTAIANLCSTKLLMPTTLTGQNGALLRQNTRIGVQGCHRSLRRGLSRAQKLARALRACRHKYKHARKKRLACEKHARRLYGVRKARRGSRTISPRKGA